MILGNFVLISDWVNFLQILRVLEISAVFLYETDFRNCEYFRKNNSFLWNSKKSNPLIFLQCRLWLKIQVCMTINRYPICWEISLVSHNFCRYCFMPCKLYIQPIIRKATTKIDDNVIWWFLSIIRQIRPKSSISIV